MQNDDILRAVAGLRKILDLHFPSIQPKEMDKYQQTSLNVPRLVQAAHLKNELERIPGFLAEDTQSHREKAMRWLSDVGGVMRSEMRLISLRDLRDLFRPATSPQ